MAGQRIALQAGHGGDQHGGADAVAPLIERPERSRFTTPDAPSTDPRQARHALNNPAVAGAEIKGSALGVCFDASWQKDVPGQQ